MSRATLDAKLKLNSAEFQGGLTRATRESSIFVGKINQQFASIRNLAIGGALGVGALGFARGLLDARMESEKLEAAMSASAGNALLGKRNLAEVKRLAGDVGLEVSGAAKAMIQFQSAGMTAAESLRAIKASYNAILSTGGGTNEFGLFAVAIQQIRNSPKVIQQDLNQLRNALPTTARLMQEAFGAQRAEDIQKLNISGREFVDTLISAMEALPQMGDTMEKQIKRVASQWQDLKAEFGATLSPAVTKMMEWSQRDLKIIQSVARVWADLDLRMSGINPDEIRAETKRRGDDAEARADRISREKRALEAFNEEHRRGAEAMEASAKNVQVLSGIFGKFQNIIDKTRESMLELRDARLFDDNMRTFLDADAAQAWEDAISQTRNQNARQLQEIRDRKKQEFDDAMARQMQGRADAEDILKGQQGEIWRDKIAKEGMTRGERKAARQEERDFERNKRRAEAREARDRLREEKREARKAGFDELKRNGFFDEEAAKKRIKDQVKKEAEEAVKSSAMTLIEIKAILERLATA